MASGTQIFLARRDEVNHGERGLRESLRLAQGRVKGVARGSVV
jgi:hypothetical protein